MMLSNMGPLQDRLNKVSVSLDLLLSHNLKKSYILGITTLRFPGNFSTVTKQQFIFPFLCINGSSEKYLNHTGDITIMEEISYRL